MAARPPVEPVILWDGRVDLFGTWIDGVRTWPWRWAPRELVTKRQLTVQGLRPAGQEPYGRIICRRGRRWAWLYRIDLAAPKQVVTPAKRAALAKAMAARRWCDTCSRDVGYCVPRISLGSCVECWLAGQSRTRAGDPDITVEQARVIPSPRPASETATATAEVAR